VVAPLAPIATRIRLTNVDPIIAAALPTVAEDGDDPVSYFLGSRLPGPADPIAQLIRGHWGGCAIRNHGTRDVQWKEAKTLSGNWALNACLAILRVTLLSVEFRQGVTDMDYCCEIALHGCRA